MQICWPLLNFLTRKFENMMMIVEVTNCTKEIAVVVNEMEELGKTIGVDIHCQREDIFEKMHRL